MYIYLCNDNVIIITSIIYHISVRKVKLVNHLYDWTTEIKYSPYFKLQPRITNKAR